MKSVIEGRKTIHELFVEAGQIDRLFTGTTPTDLFRFSETNGPLSDKMLMYPLLADTPMPSGRVRSADVQREEIPPGSSNFYILPNMKMALSLFDGPANFPKVGNHFVVPQGVQIPPGLVISRDRLNKHLGYTHYSVHGAMIMHELHYLFLLRRFAASAIPFARWKSLFPDRAKNLNN